MTLLHRRIYVASSWRNPFYEEVITTLRADGHHVHDWRNPETAFRWQQVDMPIRPTALENRTTLLKQARCAQGFLADFRGMQWADTCVLLLPAGRSAHLEAGWCKGAGKRAIVLLRDNEEPDLMNLLFDELAVSLNDLRDMLFNRVHV